MRDFFNLVKQRKIIFDGGMGSILISKGLRQGEVPEKWILEKHEVVQQIHKEYIEAGADVIETNTFGGSRIKLSFQELGKKVKEINQTAAKIALEILPQDKYLAGDIGPIGKFMKPLGTLEPEEVEDTFIEQATILAEAGVHLFIIETMYDLNEALIALKAVKKVCNLPVIVSLTYKSTPKGFFTIMGNDISQSFKQLQEQGADIVGANCTLSSPEMLGLVKQIRKSVTVPVIAQPNAGNPVLEGDKTVYKETAEEFVHNAVLMYENGVNIIGGCCGTTPEFIEKLYESVNKIQG